MDDIWQPERNYSNGTETWKTEELYPWTLILMDLLQSIGFAVGLLANAFLMALFAATPRPRSVSSKIIVQRAVADVFALIPIPFIIYSRVNRIHDHDQGLCKTFGIILQVGIVASNVFLMAIALDGYQAAHPQQHKPSLRRKTMILTSTTAWVLAAATGVAAYFLSYNHVFELCTFGPFFNHFALPNILMQVFLLLAIPLIVVWSLVSVALPPHPTHESEAMAVPKAIGNEGPNRRLLLGLASSFTVLQGYYWLVVLLNQFLPISKALIIDILAYSMITFNEPINAILAICLSEDLRQQAIKWLPSRFSRHLASVPLQDL